MVAAWPKVEATRHEESYAARRWALWYEQWHHAKYIAGSPTSIQPPGQERLHCLEGHSLLAMLHEGLGQEMLGSQLWGGERRLPSQRHKDAGQEVLDCHGKRCSIAVGQETLDCRAQEMFDSHGTGDLDCHGQEISTVAARDAWPSWTGVSTAMGQETLGCRGDKDLDCHEQEISVVVDKRSRLSWTRDSRLSWQEMLDCRGTGDA